MAIARYVNIAFVAFGLMIWPVLAELFGWIFSLVGPGMNQQLIGHNFRVADCIGLVLAGGTTYYIGWMHEEFRTFAMEAGNELSKVTWPTWSETRLSTIVVIITTMIIAAILGVFDYLWAALSSLVYDV